MRYEICLIVLLFYENIILFKMLLNLLRYEDKERKINLVKVISWNFLFVRFFVNFYY